MAARLVQARAGSAASTAVGRISIRKWYELVRGEAARETMVRAAHARAAEAAGPNAAIAPSTAAAGSAAASARASAGWSAAGCGLRSRSYWKSRYERLVALCQMGE